MDTFTGYAQRGPMYEEVDVEAESLDEAVTKIQAILDTDYLPGFDIVSVTRRTGLFI